MLTEHLNRMISDGRIIELYILARYFYRTGEPVIDDRLYDRMEKVLRDRKPEEVLPFLNRSYDDDPIPEKLLEEIGVKPVVFLKRSEYGELAAILDDDKSLSMSAVTNADAAYGFFMDLRRNKLDFVSSLKVDGVNTKMMYLDGELCLSLSRGRNDGIGFDYMKGSSKVMPLCMKNHGGMKYLKVTGESYVEKSALPYFRKKYAADKYKTSKSSAISMLRTRHSREDYRYLHTLVFHAEGLADTLTGMFEHLQQEGFETVPYLFHPWTEIPENRETFGTWLLRSVMQPVWEAGNGLPSDGCAIEVNDFNWAGGVEHQYSDRQIALKFGPWKYKVYKGEITDIRLEQKRVYKSVKIEIKPVITDDDCKAEVINSFNPSILIENGLEKGKKVYFEKNAGAVNILIHGDRLREIAGDHFDG